MVVVLAYVEVKEGAAQEFVKAANKCVEATRKETNNISYKLYSDTESALKFVVVEEWESKAALDAHMQTPHFADFGAQIKDLLAVPLDITVYEANKI